MCIRCIFPDDEISYKDVPIKYLRKMTQRIARDFTFANERPTKRLWFMDKDNDNKYICIVEFEWFDGHNMQEDQIEYYL